VGSCKIRGAVNLLAGMSDAERARGLVTATCGNHGHALAQAAREFGTPLTAFVPRGNRPDRNAVMTGLGARVVEAGHDFDAAMLAAEREARSSGARLVHPAREPALMAGVATLALEMLEQAGRLDALFLPVGGGLAAAGTSLVFKALSPETRIYGVQSENAPAMHHAWHTGEHRAFAVSGSIADGLALRVPVADTLGVLEHTLDGMLLVSEEAIHEAIRTYAGTIHQIADGAAAVGLAAAMTLRDELTGQRVGLVITGGNIDTETLGHVLAGGGPRHDPQAMPYYPISELSYGY
jgi:threonine dehydratase